MQTDLAAVDSRSVDDMNLEDSRPTTLLEGDDVEEVLSSISTVKIESCSPGSISRAFLINFKLVYKIGHTFLPSRKGHRRPARIVKV